MPFGPMKTKAQKQAGMKVVMDEWKSGKLHSGSTNGPVVKSQKQAIAIGLSETGQSKPKTPKTKKPPSKMATTRPKSAAPGAYFAHRAPGQARPGAPVPPKPGPSTGMRVSPFKGMASRPGAHRVGSK